MNYYKQNNRYIFAAVERYRINSKGNNVFKGVFVDSIDNIDKAIAAIAIKLKPYIDNTKVKEILEDVSI